MKIQLQENEVNLVNLGSSKEENGTLSRNVTFEINGKTFDRDILLTTNGNSKQYGGAEDFYTRNKEAVDNSLIEFFSENHLYFNQ